MGLGGIVGILKGLGGGVWNEGVQGGIDEDDVQPLQDALLPEDKEKHQEAPSGFELLSAPEGVANPHIIQDAVLPENEENNPDAPSRFELVSADVEIENLTPHIIRDDSAGTSFYQL